MPVKVSASPRQIMFNNAELTDLNPALPVSDVVRLHAASNPALTSATVEGPEIKGGVRVYTVKTRVGNKG